MIWCVFWISLVYDTPEEHPWISKKERNYIQNSLGDSLNKNKVIKKFQPLLKFVNLIYGFSKLHVFFIYFFLVTHSLEKHFNFSSCMGKFNCPMGSQWSCICFTYTHPHIPQVYSRI